MSDCEHLQLLKEPNLQVGKCRCQSCGTVMPLSEGYNCLLEAMRKRIKQFDSQGPKDIFNSMIEHNEMRIHKRRKYILNCCFCQKDFITEHPKQIFCSHSCYNQNRKGIYPAHFPNYKETTKSKATKEKMSKSAIGKSKMQY